MKKLKVTLVVIPFMLVIIMTACLKDEIDLDKISSQIYWNPKIGVPIAYGNLSIADLIESIDSSENVYEDENNFLSLVYSNKILSGTAENILKIPDQQYSEVLLESDYNLPPLPIQDTITLSRTNKYTFSFDHGEVIDSVILKSGTMLFQVSSSYKFKGVLKIVLPKLMKNNVPLEITINIDKTDGSFSAAQNYDLAGYSFQLEHPNPNDNLITYDYTAKLINSGGGVSIGDKISVNIDFNDIFFSSMFGYIGQLQLLDYQSGIRIPLFQNVSKPNISFFDPKLKIITANSFGVPARVELYNVKAHSEKDNITVNVGFTPGVNPFNISYPPTIGNTSHDTVTYSTLTTNLDQALSIGPNNFYYGIRSSANPAGKTLNYVTDSSKIDISMDIELPLDLKTSLLEFSDTIDMDLNIGDNTDKIKSLLIHSSFENGMPVDLNVQVILLNENYAPVDTLFKTSEQPVVSSGTVNQQGKVSGTTTKEIDIVFTNSRIEKLKDVRYAIVKAGIITYNGGATFVKFYSNYTLNVNFGVQTELEIKED